MYSRPYLPSSSTFCPCSRFPHTHVYLIALLILVHNLWSTGNYSSGGGVNLPRPSFFQIRETFPMPQAWDFCVKQIYLRNFPEKFGRIGLLQFLRCLKIMGEATFGQFLTLFSYCCNAMFLGSQVPTFLDSKVPKFLGSQFPMFPSS